MNPAGKAIILARGLGTRMRREDARAQLDAAQSAVADAGLKAMIPIGRPFLDYVLSELADAGFTDVCLVIGPEHLAVRRYYAEVRPERVRIYIAEQAEPKGTADALLAAEPFAGTDQFVVLNSDNYYPEDVLVTLRTMDGPGAVMFDEDSLVSNSNIPAERIRQFAYARVDAEGFLQELVEKPDQEALSKMHGNAWVSMNCWRFGPGIFQFCRSVPKSERREYELPVAVRTAIHAGMRLRIVPSRSGVLDLSTRADVVAVANRLRNVRVSL